MSFWNTFDVSSFVHHAQQATRSFSEKVEKQMKQIDHTKHFNTMHDALASALKPVMLENEGSNDGTHMAFDAFDTYLIPHIVNEERKTSKHEKHNEQQQQPAAPAPAANTTLPLAYGIPAQHGSKKETFVTKMDQKIAEKTQSNNGAHECDKKNTHGKTEDEPHMTQQHTKFGSDDHGVQGVNRGDGNGDGDALESAYVGDHEMKINVILEVQSTSHVRVYCKMQKKTCIDSSPQIYHLASSQSEKSSDTRTHASSVSANWTKELSMTEKNDCSEVKDVATNQQKTLEETPVVLTMADDQNSLSNHSTAGMQKNSDDDFTVLTASDLSKQVHPIPFSSCAITTHQVLDSVVLTEFPEKIQTQPHPITSSVVSNPSAVLNPHQAPETSLLEDFTEMGDNVFSDSQGTQTMVIKLNKLLEARDAQIDELTAKLSAAQKQLRNVQDTVNEKCEELQHIQQQLISEQQQVARLSTERDQLRQVRDKNDSVAQALIAKDEQINAILKEGEVLVRKQQQLEAIMKKVRKEATAKDEENAQLKNEIDTLNDNVKKKNELIDNKQKENFSLANRIQDLQKQNSVLMSQSRKTEESLSKYKQSLELTQSELNIRNHKITELELELAALNSMKKALQSERERAHTDSQGASHRVENLLRNVEALRQQLKQREDEFNQLENQFDSELKQLRNRLQQAEDSNEELVSAVPQATRPLLRQIENLQASMASQSEFYSNLESQLNAKINESELKLAHVRAERDSLSKEASDAESKIAVRDMQIESLKENATAMKQTIKELEDRLCEEKEKVRSTQHDLNTAQELYDNLGSTCTKLREECKRIAEEKQNLENRYEQQMNSERMTKQQELEMRSSYMVPLEPSTPKSSTATVAHDSTPRHTGSRKSSFSSSDWALNLGETTASSPAQELLKSMIRHKDGELKGLRQELRNIQQYRDSLLEEIVSLMAANTTLQDKVLQLEQSMQLLENRHEVALQVIGEKEDELQDLRSDLQHVKCMFQGQVTDLLQQLDAMRQCSTAGHYLHEENNFQK